MDKTQPSRRAISLATAAILSVAVITVLVFMARDEIRVYYKSILFRMRPVNTDKIVFLGDSLTRFGRWNELLDDESIINCGRCGDTTAAVLNRLGGVTALKPRKIFLMVGINDIIIMRDPGNFLVDYDTVLSRIKAGSPDTRIYVQSILPVAKEFGVNNEISAANLKIRELARLHGAEYVDLHRLFVAPDGGMDMRYSEDGVHLNGDGYIVWKRAVEGLVR